MGRRRSLDDWRRAVFISRQISDPVRVLLLFMADHMKSSNRHVSVPRKTIADALGKSERRISERVSAAHAAGFLSTISPGYRGHVPVYQGLFPDAERETCTSPLSGAETRTLSERKRVTPGRPTITRADLSLRGDDRNGGNYEEHEPSTAAFRLTDCDWHPHTRCPADCANHPIARQESA